MPQSIHRLFSPSLCSLTPSAHVPLQALTLPCHLFPLFVLVYLYDYRPPLILTTLRHLAYSSLIHLLSSILLDALPSTVVLLILRNTSYTDALPSSTYASPSRTLVHLHVCTCLCAVSFSDRLFVDVDNVA